jgi:hypothetical protein
MLEFSIFHTLPFPYLKHGLINLTCIWLSTNSLTGLVAFHSTFISVRSYELGKKFGVIVSCVRFQVLTAARMKFRVFRDVALCSFVGVDESSHWRLRQYVPLKRRSTPRLHGAISQKTLNFVSYSCRILSRRRGKCNLNPNLITETSLIIV